MYVFILDTIRFFTIKMIVNNTLNYPKQFQFLFYRAMKLFMLSHSSYFETKIIFHNHHLQEINILHFLCFFSISSRK